MNNDAAPVPAADLPTTSSASNGNVSSSSDNSNGSPAESGRDDAAPESTPTPTPTPSLAQIRATLQMKKKYEFVNHIMTNLDMLIYVELCILYYMDCSFFRFIIRVLAQIMFLTPKPSFVPPMPKNRPYIGAIFGPNFICMLLHIICARPEAGEAMRGYLHGGIMIDLIGQKGPTSKTHLLLLDLLVMVLQCFMLAVHVEREQLRDVLLPKAVQQSTGVAVITAQDHDAEERGTLRDAVSSTDDIEMQPLNVSSEPQAHNTDSETEQERERLLAEPTTSDEAEDEDFPLDIFYSGTAVVGEFHVLHTLRTQWDDYGNATASALQTVGFSAEFAAATADRRVGAMRRNFQASLNR